MIKKIVIVVALLALAGGGFWLFKYFEQQNQYNNAPDKVATDFTNAMIAGDTETAYNYLSDNLKNEHQKQYWLDFFAEYKDYSDTLKLSKKEEVRSVNSSEPDSYDNAFQPWRFVYDLKRNNLAYQLTMVIYKPTDQWKINELYGNYVSTQ